MDIRSGIEPGSAARAARNVPAPASIRIPVGSAAKAAEDRAREAGAAPSTGLVGIRLRAGGGAQVERVTPHEDGGEARPTARSASLDTDGKGNVATTHAEPGDPISIAAGPDHESSGVTPRVIKRLFRRWFGRSMRT